jgi:hypothetical protein
MRWLLCGFAVLGWTLWSPATAHAQQNALTQEEIAQGWTLLFDGKTTEGWMVDGDAEVVDGVLVLGGKRATSAGHRTLLGRTFELRLEYRTDPGDWVLAKPGWLPPINIRWETSKLFGRSSGSRGFDRYSKDRNEWIEIVYTGEFDPKTGMRSVKSRFRAVGEAAFKAQDVGGTTNEGGTRVSFQMPSGPKLHLRNVKVRGEIVGTVEDYFTYLWICVAVVLGFMLACLAAILLIWARRRRLHTGAESKPPQ